MLKTAGLAALALALVSTSALAQQRYVAFGDSLSDNGNLFAVTGQPPAPYFNGRFSNGPTFVELLSGGSMNGFIPPQILTQPSQNVVNTASTNYAFGGARTDALVANPPGTGAQIGAYLQRGGRFGSSDIVTLWAGANDIFQAIPTAAANPATAQTVMQGVAATAAGNVAQQTAQLSAAGARQIVVLNLPNFSALPQFAGGPAAALAGISSATFNTALATGLGTVAAQPGAANVVSIDVAGVFNAIQTNPAAFGFANASQACISTPSCVGVPSARNSFLFWDGVHPTAAAHQLVAGVVQQHLDAPRLATAYTLFGETALDERRLGMGRAFDRLDGAQRGKPGVNAYFVSVFGSTMNADGSFTRPSLRNSSYGVNAGFDRALTNQLALTGAAAFSVGKAKAGGILSADTFNAAFDVGASYTSGIFFAKAGAGLGVTRFSGIERTTIGPLSNSASNINAVSYNLGAEIGTRHEFGLFELSPRARLAWLGGSIGRIEEAGLVAPLAIASQTLNALLAGAELRATANIVNTASQKVSVTALVGYERYLSYDGNALSARLVNNTARGFQTVSADPKGPGLILGLGFASTMASGWAISADYRASIGDRSQVRHSGQLGVRTAF